MTVSRKRLLIGLATSLLLNMFLAGFIVARLSMRPPRSASIAAGPPGPPSDDARPPFPRDRADRPDRAWRRLLRPERKDLRRQRSEIHAARRAVSDALVADPFDKAKLATALEDLRATTGEAQAALHNALLAAAPQMSAEDRAKLSRAHRLWSAPPGARPHRRPR